MAANVMYLVLTTLRIEITGRGTKLGTLCLHFCFAYFLPFKDDHACHRATKVPREVAHQAKCSCQLHKHLRSLTSACFSTGCLQL